MGQLPLEPALALRTYVYAIQKVQQVLGNAEKTKVLGNAEKTTRYLYSHFTIRSQQEKQDYLY